MLKKLGAIWGPIKGNVLWDGIKLIVLPVVSWLINWAIRSPENMTIAIGIGVFLLGILWSRHKNRNLSLTSEQQPQLTGACARTAREPYLSWFISLVLLVLFWLVVSPYYRGRVGDLHNGSSTTGSGIAAEFHLISGINTNYEDNYNLFSQDGLKLKDLSRQAFDSGDYAYCVMCYDQFISVYSDPASRDCEPLKAGAMLALNPTEKGYKEFHDHLADMVKRVRSGQWTKEYSPLGEMIANLGKVKRRAPKSEWAFIDGISDQIKQIRVAPSKDPPP
ncbi:MAG: hypothetical protein JWR26_437 [Pedosphaera sp.]|nr:hypothetical protein [Pedosphaera sp.]